MGIKTISEQANKLLQNGLPRGSSILDIQIALKLLGFMPNNWLKQCDGKWGNSTNTGIQALNWDIFKREEDTTVNYGKISELLLNKEWFKVPFVESPKEANKEIQEYIKSKKEEIIKIHQIPFDFLWALLWQETNLNHYDKDGFVYVGCDFGEPNYKYRSRGWGLGQYTIRNHPPDIDQQKNIVEPLKNLEFAISHFKMKFKVYCRQSRICNYNITDSKYLRDCVNCVETSQKMNVKLENANYHPKAQVGYNDVPLLSVCDWGLAIERYNGAGQNAIAYKYEVLMKILGVEIR